MHRYLDEFTFRFNNREAENLFAMVLINVAIRPGISTRNSLLRFGSGSFLGLGFAIVDAVSGPALRRRFSKSSNRSLETFTPSP